MQTNESVMNTLPILDMDQVITNGNYSMKLRDAASLTYQGRTWYAQVMNDWSIQVAIRHRNGVYETWSVNVPERVLCKRGVSTMSRSIETLPMEVISALVLDKQLVDIGLVDDCQYASRAA
jgi:hypothetical protein